MPYLRWFATPKLGRAWTSTGPLKRGRRWPDQVYLPAGRGGRPTAQAQAAPELGQVWHCSGRAPATLIYLHLFHNRQPPASRPCDILGLLDFICSGPGGRLEAD